MPLAAGWRGRNWRIGRCAGANQNASIQVTKRNNSETIAVENKRVGGNNRYDTEWRWRQEKERKGLEEEGRRNEKRKEARIEYL